MGREIGPTPSPRSWEPLPPRMTRVRGSDSTRSRTRDPPALVVGLAVAANGSRHWSDAWPPEGLGGPDAAPHRPNSGPKTVLKVAGHLKHRWCRRPTIWSPEDAAACGMGCSFVWSYLGLRRDDPASIFPKAAPRSISSVGTCVAVQELALAEEVGLAGRVRALRASRFQKLRLRIKRVPGPSGHARTSARAPRAY